MAARRERGLFDPDAAAGRELVRPHCLGARLRRRHRGGRHQRGVLAGRAPSELGNLVVIYDANQISIEDDTAIALSEDTGKRYEAYGWHVQTVDWTGGHGADAGRDGEYHEDVPALHAALRAAQDTTDRPSLVDPAHRDRLAGAGRPEHRQGARSGARRGRGRRHQGGPRLRPGEELRRRPTRCWPGPARSVERGRAMHAGWEERFAAWRPANPERATLLRPDARAPSCPTAGPTRCRPSRPARTWPPARPPARC